MQPINPAKKKTVIVVTIALLLLGLIAYVTITGKIPKTITKPIQEIVSVETRQVELPVRLQIPKINVDAAVEYVGVTPQGAMAVPKGPDGVGWYGPGPRPGEVGSSVISGHYGWKNNIPAVFDHLNKLQVGDMVYVVDAKGATTTFVVKEIRSYGEKQDASDVFTSKDGGIHLNLITCEGVWNKATKSYSKRLVVFTDKVI